MRASNVTKAVALALSVAWVAGCSTSGTSESTGSTAGTDTGSTQGVSQNGGVSSSSMDDVANLQTVFYFDFDQSVVKANGFADLEKHAAYLAANPSAQVILEGHADERGTREYNMALGERRAKAISRYLTIQGVAASQIETVSFGEEVPVAFGHDSNAWQLNRRVEVRYE